MKFGGIQVGKLPCKHHMHKLFSTRHASSYDAYTPIILSCDGFGTFSIIMFFVRTFDIKTFGIMEI